MASKVMSEVFAATQEKYAGAADRAEGGWLPGGPNAGQNWEGTVLLQGVAENEGEKDGYKYVSLKPKFQILDGEYENRTFTDDIYISTKPTDKDQIGQSKLARLASCLAGETIKDQATAYAKIMEAVPQGATMTCKVVWVAGKGQNAGKTFQNVYFNKRLS